MWVIIAKSTGKVLRNVEEEGCRPVLFDLFSDALDYLKEWYTEAGVQLWRIEKV